MNLKQLTKQKMHEHKDVLERLRLHDEGVITIDTKKLNDMLKLHHDE